MNWVDDWALSLGTFLPAVGAAVLIFIPSGSEKLVKAVGTLFAFLALVAGVVVLARFDFSNAGAL